MATVEATRVANLKALIEQHGGVSKFSRRLGYANPSFLSQMVGPNPTREITEKSARKIEAKLGVAPGTLDQNGVAAPPVAAAPADATTALIVEVLRRVGKACESEGVNASPSKVGEVAVLAYLDAVEHGGVPREEHMRRLARLIK
jgi:DNA-binding transcriptional regulator YdaS (Cro superfamily)